MINPIIIFIFKTDEKPAITQFTMYILVYIRLLFLTKKKHH